jgi:hypothetical protein
MVDTFWPTVGTVFRFGCAWGEFEAFICSSSVVFPALSRPSRRTEYSGLRQSSERMPMRRLHTFFTGGIEVYTFE